MHEHAGWFLDARWARFGMAVWLGAVLVYGLWRSSGAAPQDPIRESGPIM